MGDSLERLYRSVIALQKGDPAVSRTTRLMHAGRAKVAKKLAEEAAEVVIDAMQGNREAVVRESADLLYHLVVLWAETGIRPAQVWSEMERREKLMGLAEKLPKESSKGSPAATLEAGERRKVVALESRRTQRRR